MPASRNGLRYMYLFRPAVGGAEGDRTADLRIANPSFEGFPGLSSRSPRRHRLSLPNTAIEAKLCQGHECGHRMNLCSAGPYRVRRNLKLGYGALELRYNHLNRLARPRGVEPLTPRSVVWCCTFCRHGLLAGQHARRQCEEQRSVADRADRFAVSERRCGLRRRPVIC
jgi:hypothetical protein